MPANWKLSRLFCENWKLSVDALESFQFTPAMQPHDAQPTTPTCWQLLASSELPKSVRLLFAIRFLLNERRMRRLKAKELHLQRELRLLHLQLLHSEAGMISDHLGQADLRSADKGQGLGVLDAGGGITQAVDQMQHGGEVNHAAKLPDFSDASNQ